MDWSTVVVSISGSAISGSLAAGLINFLIERTKARQSRELLDTQNAFSVGATSHMATVAFDNYICFCQDYVDEVSKALEALILDASAQEPLDVRSFSRIRRKWTLWLTNEIDGELEQFERRVTQLGGEAPAVDADGNRVSDENSIQAAIAFLRRELRTEELTALRNELVIRSSLRTRSGA